MLALKVSDEEEDKTTAKSEKHPKSHTINLASSETNPDSSSDPDFNAFRYWQAPLQSSELGGHTKKAAAGISNLKSPTDDPDFQNFMELKCCVVSFCLKFRLGLLLIEKN